MGKCWETGEVGRAKPKTPAARTRTTSSLLIDLDRSSPQHRIPLVPHRPHRPSSIQSSYIVYFFQQTRFAYMRRRLTIESDYSRRLTPYPASSATQSVPSFCADAIDSHWSERKTPCLIPDITLTRARSLALSFSQCPAYMHFRLLYNLLLNKPTNNHRFRAASMQYHTNI